MHLSWFEGVSPAPPPASFAVSVDANGRGSSPASDFVRGGGSERLNRRGLCSCCGRIKTHGRRNWRMRRRPLTVKGLVHRGYCLRCYTLKEAASMSEIEALERRMRKNDPTLTFVQQQSENLPGNIGAEVLADALSNNTTVKVLWIVMGGIGDRGAAALADAICYNKTMSVINLWGNRIGGAGATAIAHAIRKNFNITELILRGNHIGDAGATALAEALGFNDTLTTLNLGEAGIGPKGSAALAEALHENTGLTELDLQGNLMGDEGARAFSAAFQWNGTLATLNLRGTGINAEGSIAIANALLGNSSLKRINLRHNAVGASGARALADALRCNNTLTGLVLPPVKCEMTRRLIKHGIKVNQQGPLEAAARKSTIVSRALLGDKLQLCIFPWALGGVASRCSLDTMFRLVKNWPDLFAECGLNTELWVVYNS